MLKIFLDGADLNQISEFKDRVSGFTTNPTLIRKAGVKDYKGFARVLCNIVQHKPISFEVFADDFEGMEKQAREISSWGENIYVKIPVTNTKGESCGQLINKLGAEGIKVNVTAVTTLDQIRNMCRFMFRETPTILSIFAGRIADTGRDPVPFITAALAMKHDKTEILWASSREVLNIKQAQAAGCDIITLQPELIRKMDLFSKDLAEYSLETVKQFYEDAKGLTL